MNRDEPEQQGVHSQAEVVRQRGCAHRQWPSRGYHPELGGLPKTSLWPTASGDDSRDQPWAPTSRTGRRTALARLAGGARRRAWNLAQVKVRGHRYTGSDEVLPQASLQISSDYLSC